MITTRGATERKGGPAARLGAPSRVVLALAIWTGAGACSRGAEKAPTFAEDEASRAEPLMMAPGSPAQAAKEEGKAGAPTRKRALKVGAIGGLGLSGRGAGGGGLGDAFAAEADAAPEDAPAPSEPAAATRSWFPETFLFEPLVVTDDVGVARVPVRVPDRLTTWRVLALAHSRDGAQAGAEVSFLGTLPTYVDPIVPAFLLAGDEVSLPIQVVNTTNERVTRTLRVEVTGAALSRGSGPVTLEPFGSRVEWVPLRASKPGEVVLRASLGDRDAVEKTITVHPTGRPWSQRRGGTLAAPRELSIELPADASTESTTARLSVFPGALAILRSELSAAGGRGGEAGDAYALLLAGRGEGLLRSLGGDPDPKALRALAIVAGQRAIRAARSPDVPTAALFAGPALAHPESPVLSRLGERLADTVARGQRPDGTFEGASGWTLQRLLVVTAECVRAVRSGPDEPKARQRAKRVMLSAEGAFERNAERVDDGYTAAAILASGAVKGALAEKLEKRVLERLERSEDGSRVLRVGPGVLRGDGLAPSAVEASALAVLALSAGGRSAEARAAAADLGAFLLASYTPWSGFGDGRTNLIALFAVLELFAEPLPARVHVALELDGRTIAEGVLEGAKLKETLALVAPLPDARGKHTYRVRAEPALAGLGFSLELDTFVPWKKEAPSGLELEVSAPKEARAGQPVDVSIVAVAPGGLELTVDVALPAGVALDKPSAEALVDAGSIRSFDDSDGHLVMEVPARAPGQTFAATVRVIPTLVGTLQSGAHAISAGGQTVFVPPSRWKIR